MAEIVKEELKDMLVDANDESAILTSKTNRLPSPKQLFGKILIKVMPPKILQ